MAESEDFVRTGIETLKDVRALWWAVTTIGAAVVAWLFLPVAIATFFLGSFLSFLFIGLFVHQSEHHFAIAKWNAEEAKKRDSGSRAVNTRY